ncbi:MAG TPA: efflux RND transporter permease subunit [Desulfitobacteriaceae bacterium]|nr:efflux RND transporter permease subunit [Desulfitobacteriaceae bacterium]
MIELAIRKKNITILIFVIAVIGGIYGFFTLPMQESPDITSYTAVVTTVLPGGTPETVEKTVTKEIEAHLKEMQGIKAITSDSRDSVSIVTVELKKNQKPKEKWDELRKKVDNAAAKLPAEAQKPQVNDDLAKNFVQTINITANSFAELYAARATIEDLQNTLKTIEGVADVTVIGLPQKQVRVDLDTQKLFNFGVSWGQVAAAIQANQDKTPLGNLNSDNHSYQLVLSEQYDAANLNNIAVATTQAGDALYLRDVGQAYLTTEEAGHYVYHNGKPAINLTLTSEAGNDVPSTQKKVNDKLAGFEKSMPAGLQYENLYSADEHLSQMFSGLAREMVVAILAVIFVCSLGLSLINALIIALAIPISMAISLLAAPLFDVTFNQLTIFGLIVVLGILVDDAVVVNDNIERHVHLGMPIAEAAIRGSKEVFTSIVTATLATICTFLPTAFMQGMLGQFTRPLPIIVCVSMLASMVMSLTIIPIFRQWHGQRAKLKGKAEGAADGKAPGLLGKQISKLINWYADKYMPRILKKPVKAVLLSALVTVLAYSLVTVIPIQLFPTADRGEFLINIANQTGSSIAATDEVVRGVAKWVSSQPNVEKVSSFAGGPAPAMFSTDEFIQDSAQSGQIFVKVDTSKTSVAALVGTWGTELEKLYPAAEIVPKDLQSGLPIGKPVVLRIYGKDMDQLRSLAQDVKEKLKKIAGTTDIKDNIGIDNYSYQIAINEPLRAKLQVDYAALTSSIRLMSDGITVAKFDDQNDLSDIVIYANKSGGSTTADFERLYITNARGQQIPLTQIARITPSFAINSIPHRNLTRYVEISSGVQGRATAAGVMSQIKKDMGTLTLPEGYTWEAGGETVESVDVFADLLQLLVVSAVLILLLIILQFYTFRAPLIIAVTFLLAFGGSILGIFITGKQLGFMAILGIITLIGIVARNGIVLIEFIENERQRGLELHEAVINAGKARLRPVLLTALTAIAGLIPMAVAGEELFKSMAISIIFGLAYATILTLVVVPSLYVILARRKIKRENARKEAEPAETILD